MRTCRYDIGLVPSSFQYTPDISAAECLDLYPWVFIDPDSAVGKLAWQVRRSDGRNLIPFAVVEDDRKDFACFDGDDSSGNPSVMIFSPDGSGRSYGFSDFSTWLEAAKADAEDWRKHYGDLR